MPLFLTKKKVGLCDWLSGWMNWNLYEHVTAILDRFSRTNWWDFLLVKLWWICHRWKAKKSQWVVTAKGRQFKRSNSFVEFFHSSGWLVLLPWSSVKYIVSYPTTWFSLFEQLWTVHHCEGLDMMGWHVNAKPELISQMSSLSAGAVFMQMRLWL